MIHYPLDNLLPVDSDGFYGSFGGAYVPEKLLPIIRELEEAFRRYIADPAFQTEYDRLLHEYVGRPTPLYFSSSLSNQYGTKIFLKREDLNHTGAHKINNAIGQALLAVRMGKKKIIAETGAGQHGVATATVAALLGLECEIFMGAEDVRRQHQNVMRMEMLGAKVISVDSGSATLSNAVDAALAAWAANPDETFYLIGSAVGPHPYPEIVSRFQSVISHEIRLQLKELTGRENPDCIIACIGGGSNASGAFYHFLEKPEVRLIAVEAGGHGIESRETAASISAGKPAILHGSKTMVLTCPDGKPAEAYSISSGLDYPGVGPLIACLAQQNRAEIIVADDNEALAAAYNLARRDGIIPALESSHALAALDKTKFRPDDIVVISLSGRGDKDMDTFLSYPPCREDA